MADERGQGDDANQQALPRDTAEAIDALVEQVDRLRADRDADRAVLDDLLAELARRGLTAPPAETVYPTWTDWVDHWLVPRISRSPHRHRWCHHYADHAEVADRLETLWHTWETHWPDPLARNAWYRDGLDHHWPLITADDGPLRSCSAAERVHAAGRDGGDLAPT